MGGIFSQFLSDVQLLLSEIINLLPFLWKYRYQATAIARWKEIYKHLGNILKKSETSSETSYSKECEEITVIPYKTLTIGRICGKIAVDDILTTLSQWEVSC